MESTTLVKEWSTPPKKTVLGEQPPAPARPETIKSEMREQDVQFVTPMYKSTNPAHGKPPNLQHSSRAGAPRKMSNEPDYREEQQQEHYKLHIIDPKVESHAHIPVHSTTLPSTFRKRNKTPDFPSAHSKRSFLKLDPLEPRKIRSVEVRPITTTDYLSESLERHRAMVQSPLREQLKVRETEVNKSWEKPTRPGPRVQWRVPSVDAVWNSEVHHSETIRRANRRVRFSNGVLPADPESGPAGNLPHKFSSTLHVDVPKFRHF